MMAVFRTLLMDLRSFEIPVVIVRTFQDPNLNAGFFLFALLVGAVVTVHLAGSSTHPVEQVASGGAAHHLLRAAQLKR